MRAREQRDYNWLLYLALFVLLLAVGSLPGQAARDLQLQGETEKCSNQHNGGKKADVLQRGRHDNGTNDITGDEQFEAEQDGAGEANAIRGVGFCRSKFPQPHQVRDARNGGADYDHRYPGGLHGLSGDFDG